LHQLISLLQTSTISWRISDILWAVSSSSVLVVVEIFQVLSNRDPVYGMPVLVRRNSETTFMIIPAKVRFIFNPFVIWLLIPDVRTWNLNSMYSTTATRRNVKQRAQKHKFKSVLPLKKWNTSLFTTISTAIS
jgi:hypothetical protein